MKIQNHIPIALLATFIAATSALHADSTQNKLPFPMPEFMSQSQVVAWQKDRIAKADAARASQASTSDSSTSYFYTGKPYLAESGSYAFKYREYNPEMNRWTTVDPSGFPDGANNRLYAAAPTSEIDLDGNAISTISNTFNIPLDDPFGDKSIDSTVQGTIQATLSQAPGAPSGVKITDVLKGSFSANFLIASMSAAYVIQDPNITLDSMTLTDGPVVNGILTKFWVGNAEFSCTKATTFTRGIGVSFSYEGVSLTIGPSGSVTHNFAYSATSKIGIEVE